MQIGKRKHYVEQNRNKDYVELNEKGQVKSKMDRARIKLADLRNRADKIGINIREAQAKAQAKAEKLQAALEVTQTKIEHGRAKVRRGQRKFQRGVRNFQKEVRGSGFGLSMDSNAFDLGVPDIGGFGPERKSKKSSSFSVDIPDVSGINSGKRKKRDPYSLEI